MNDRTLPDVSDPNQPRTLGSIISTVVSYAMSRGLTLDEIRDISGYTSDQLFSPEVRLPESRLPQIWSAIRRLDPTVPITIDFAKSAPLSGMLSMAYSARFGKDLRQSLELMVRNRRFLSDQLSLQLIETGDEAAIVAAHPMDAKDAGVMNQSGVGLFMRAAREVLLIDLHARRIEFESGIIGQEADYHAFFDAPIHFGHTRTAFVMDRSFLDVELESANAQLYEFADTYYRKMTEKSDLEKYPPQLVGLVKAIAQNASKGEFGVAAAATTAQMSIRSAQRIAAKNGTTMQELVREVRSVRAREFLADLNISVQEVAFLSGYTDDRAFRRAFKEWTGQSPSAYRRSLLG
ncbi:MAG: helix-turn-helix domain-containing protein [Pseudomonadota bacterium]